MLNKRALNCYLESPLRSSSIITNPTIRLGFQSPFNSRARLNTRRMTTTRASKRQRTSTGDDPYELFYWATMPGRGEHIRLAFEVTGTPYADVCNVDSGRTKSMMAHMKGHGDEHNPPPFAPPMLKHGSLIISQTPNILLYLGPKLGLVPPTEDDPDGVYHINSLALTALDGFSNEAHDVHHPIAVGLYYEDQKEEALRKAADYKTNRIPKFLDHFERVLHSKPSDGGEWLYGGKLSYADLVLFQTLDGVCYAFPKCCEKIRASGKYPKVFALYDRVKSLENIKNYLASERRLKYSNGIYRHYPELDDQD